MRVTMKRNIERFPSKQMYPYLSLVGRKVAEFYHNIDRRSWLVWVRMTYFHRFFQTIPGVLGRLDELCGKSPFQHWDRRLESKVRGKIMSQRANKLQRPFLANSIYCSDPISKMSKTAARHEYTVAGTNTCAQWHIWLDKCTVQVCR